MKFDASTFMNIQNACAHMHTLIRKIEKGTTITGEQRDDLIRYAFLIHTKWPAKDGRASIYILALNELCAKRRTDREQKTKDRCNDITEHLSEIMRICKIDENESDVDCSDDSLDGSYSDSDVNDSSSKRSAVDTDNQTSTLKAVLQQAVNTISIMVAGGRWAGHSYVETFVNYATKYNNAIPATTGNVVRHIQMSLPISMHTNTLETTIEFLKKLEPANTTGVAFTLTQCRCSSPTGLVKLFDIIETSNLTNKRNMQTLFSGMKITENDPSTEICWGEELYKIYRKLVECKDESRSSVPYTKFLRHVTCILLERGYGKIDDHDLHSFLLRVIKRDSESNVIESS
jgi:hypothetical protein